MYERMGREDTHREQYADAMRQQKYRREIDMLRADGRYVYIFHSADAPNEEIRTDIFDMRAERFLPPVRFPFLPLKIVNGYAYGESYDEDGFYMLKKYRIDPKVYR